MRMREANGEKAESTSRQPSPLTATGFSDPSLVSPHELFIFGGEGVGVRRDGERADVQVESVGPALDDLVLAQPGMGASTAMGLAWRKPRSRVVARVVGAVDCWWDATIGGGVGSSIDVPSRDSIG